MFSFKTFEKHKVLGRISNCPSPFEKGRIAKIFWKSGPAPPAATRSRAEPTFFVSPDESSGADAAALGRGDRTQSWCAKMAGSLYNYTVEPAGWCSLKWWALSPWCLRVCDVFWETDKIHMIPYIICIKRLNVDHWVLYWACAWDIMRYFFRVSSDVFQGFLKKPWRIIGGELNVQIYHEVSWTITQW